MARYVYGGDGGDGAVVANVAPVWRDELKAAAEARRDAEAELERRTQALAVLAANAKADGVPVATIADWCGLTRKTVYAYLERAEAD
jgi:L-serine deaminase